MATRLELEAQIASLKEQIRQYNEDIKELSDAKDYISKKHEKVTGVYNEMAPYDVTRDMQWLGNLCDDMSDKRDQTSGNMSAFMGKTSKFMGDIDIAIGKLKEKIGNCQEAINGLQAQLDALDDEE